MKNILIFGFIFSSFIFPRKNCLQQSETDELGRSNRPSKETFTISPSGHFYIHYDTTFSDTTSPPDLMDNDGNGIPDYVDEVGTIADSAHHVLIDVMGYDEEPYDGEGGYDIYIMSYTAGVYGYNYKDSVNTSYLLIDNDYLGYNSKFNLEPIEIMRLTVGHEYFHGIQWGYEENLGVNSYFYEMTSMWFEDILIPDGNDYLDGWVDDLLNNPTADFDKTGSGYELALFGHYLSSFIDPEGVEDEKNSSIMREIWERYRDYSPSAFAAVQDILQDPTKSYNISFIEAWVDFMTRNLYNGIYEEFYYYSDQALIDPIWTNPQILKANIENSIISDTLSLDNKSIFIQSYGIGDLTSILDIKHSSNDYIGNIVIVSEDLSGNRFFFGEDIITNQLFDDDAVHFVYATEKTNDNVNIDIIQYNVPIPPSSLTAIAAQDSIILSWNPSAGPGNTLDYIIYRKDAKDGSYNFDSLDVTADTNYIDVFEGLKEYTYYVTCINEIVDGESQPSNSVTIESWPTGNNVSENQILSIYPNPIHKTNGPYILYSLGSDYSNITLELLNIRGRIIKTVVLQSFQQGWHRENINSLILPGSAAGVYFIRLSPDNVSGKTQTVTILP